MENNTFFGTVLRSLGFKVVSVGARVNRMASGSGGDVWEGWSHMVNIVELEGGQRVMLDVGFGTNGPVEPLLLDGAGSGACRGHIGLAEMRAVSGKIALDGSGAGQELWRYLYRGDSQAEWLVMYCFAELEFLPQDYEIMNFWTSRCPRSWFTYRVVVVKMVLEGEEVVGTVVLNGGEVKRRVKGETEYLRTCRTEEERVKALEELFGLRLTDEERRGIRGMVTELRG